MKSNQDNLATLLIVDDEIALRMLLKEYFRKQYQITVLDGGKACLDWLQNNPSPDAIILDLVMPDLSGLSVIAEMRKKKIWEETAIIVLSAKESSADRIAAIRAGADDFLVKPFNPEELEVRIAAVRRRMRQVSI